MRSFGIVSLVTMALSVFAGCAVDGSQSGQTADETTEVAQDSFSRPGRLNIQFGIIGYAGGCFKGAGICSIGNAPSPWDANATGVYKNGVVTLSLAAESIPFDLRAEGGLKIEAPIAIDAKAARTLQAPEGLEIQPGFYAVRSDVESKTSIVVDVKVASSFANPANPFDWVGKLHNKAMVYGRSVLPVGATPEAVDATTSKFLASEGITLDTTKFFSSGVNKFSAELFASTAPADFLVKSGKLSERGASYYVKILDASLKNALSGDYSVSKKIEVEIMSDKTLSEQESNVLLATASVGRYSAAYVISTGVDPIQMHPIVKADVSGAIGGGISGAIGGAVVVPVVGSVPGWVAGAVLGGVGASLGEWVSSWF